MYIYIYIHMLYMLMNLKSHTQSIPSPYPDDDSFKKLSTPPRGCQVFSRMHRSPKWLPHPVHHLRWICRIKIERARIGDPTGAMLDADMEIFPGFWIGWKGMFGGRSWQLVMIRRSYFTELHVSICIYVLGSGTVLPIIHGKFPFKTKLSRYRKNMEKPNNIIVSGWCFKQRLSDSRISGPDDFGRLYRLYLL